MSYQRGTVLYSLAALVRKVLVAVTLAGFLIAGCAPASPEPEPSPEPRPHYEPVPRNLCERLRVEEIADQFGLDMSPRYEPNTAYFESPGDTAMSCGFGTVDESGRFTKVPIWGFDPSGLVSTEIFKDPEKASWHFGASLRSFRKYWPEAPVASIEGWWDEGTSVVSIHGWARPAGLWAAHG